jgi:hypothetical protein
MNVALLRDVRAQILAEPERLYMGAWQNEPIAEGCGTACCIGGWAGALSGLVKKNGTPTSVNVDWTAKGRRMLAKIETECGHWESPSELLFTQVLGISDDQATRLFHVSEWPYALKVAFNADDEDNAAYQEPAERLKAAKQRAKIAAKRITHFIRTKGAE